MQSTYPACFEPALVRNSTSPRAPKFAADESSPSRPDRVEFELGEEIATASSAQVTIALAIFKFDRMEWAIEKCTELGVARIVPVIASRTETHLATAAVKRAERWRRIALQASEQSRRISPPKSPNR